MRQSNLLINYRLFNVMHNNLRYNLNFYVKFSVNTAELVLNSQSRIKRHLKTGGWLVLINFLLTWTFVSTNYWPISAGDCLTEVTTNKVLIYMKENRAFGTKEILHLKYLKLEERKSYSSLPHQVTGAKACRGCRRRDQSVIK